MTDLKMLALDIETKPGTAYFFDAHIEYLSADKVITHPEIMAFSAQWKGDKKIIWYDLEADGREAMLSALRELLDEADLVVHFNGDRFDIPWIEGEIILEGYLRPSPVMSVDLYKVVKKHTRWAHKNLNTVSKRLLGMEKVKHPGFDLWRDCIEGEGEVRRKAWALMKRYGRRDTALMWPLFDRLLPWIRLPHPVADKEGLVCRNCGGENLQRRGTAKTLQGEYARYQCLDCGSWSRGTTRSPVGDLRAI